MKIAFLNLYGGINSRGVENFTNLLSQGLADKHRVYLLQAGPGVSVNKVKVIRVKAQVKQPQSLFSGNFFSKIRKYLFLDSPNLSVLAFSLKSLNLFQKHKFDLVIPLNGFWQVLFLKLFQPVLKYRILIIGHSGPGWDERFNLYLKPDLFIALTPQAKNWSVKVCPTTPVEFIPLAVDRKAFHKPTSLALPLKKPLLLIPAALTAYKRVDLAVRAAARFQDVNLLILGKGEEKEKIIRLGKKLLPGRFELIENASYSQMPGYYRAADVVTYPSLPQENCPMVLIESLAAGKLAVVTDSERNRWILGSAGIFCQPENLKDYSQKLKTAMFLAGAGGKEKEISNELKKFDLNKIIGSYHKIITKLVRSK